MNKNTSNIIIAGLFVVFLFSCKGEGRDTQELRDGYLEELAEESDVIGTVNAQDELSEFAAALNKTLERSVQFEAYSYSIFAPNNNSFSLDENQIEEDPDYFTDVVRYHMMGEKLLLEDLRKRLAEKEEPLILYALNGDKILFSLEGDQITIADEKGNKAYIVKSLDAVNGVVHIINNTLIPEFR